MTLVLPDPSTLKLTRKQTHYFLFSHKYYTNKQMQTHVVESNSQFWPWRKKFLAHGQLPSSPHMAGCGQAMQMLTSALSTSDGQLKRLHLLGGLNNALDPLWVF